MKVCLLGATFDTNNLGVSALTAGTIRCILYRFPDARIMLLDYARDGYEFVFPHAGKQIPIRLVNIRFSKKIYLTNNIAFLILLTLASRIIPFRGIRCQLLSRNPCLRQLQETDLVASIAGGDSFSDIYGLWRLLYVALPQLLAIFLGKRLVLLPQTIGPFQGRTARTIAKYILAWADLVYSRDELGLEKAKSLLRDEADGSKVKFCPDVGFVVDPILPSKTDILGLPVDGKGESPLVGVNISGLLFMGGYTRNNMFGLRIGYEKLIYDLIDFLIQRKHAAVLLIPHVFGTAEDSESDSVVSEKIYEALKEKYPNRIGLLRGTYSQSEIKWVIGSCDFFVGARMHACIAAVSQNIPAVTIAYSDKFVGVMQAIGLESLVVDPRRMDQEEVFKVIDDAYERRGELHQQLEQKMPQVKATVLKLFNGVDGLLARAPA